MNKFPLTVNIEAASGRGEDNHLVSDYAETVVIGVFDGLGGRSAGYGGRTGGQISSEIAARRTEGFLKQQRGKLTEDLVIRLQNNICQFLKEKADANMRRSRLGGTLAGKRLCTTLALAIIPKPKEQENWFEIGLTWIGDSRLYFLSPEKGLQQLTKDDLEIQNHAFNLIYEDSPMSQYITADMPSDWRIHYKTEKFEENGCILACTDGCFQYLPSPWDFERLLLETLNRANANADWENLLTQEYEHIKQDDVSLVLYPVGFADFESLKLSYQSRLAHLSKKFDSTTKSFDELNKLWDIYRCNYESRLKQADTEATEDSYNNKVESPFSEKLKSDDVDNKNTEQDKLAPEENDSSASKAVVDRDANEPEKSRQISDLLRLGYQHATNGYLPQAIQLYQRVIELEPNNIEANFRLGQWHFQLSNRNSPQLHNFKESIRYFNNVVNQHREQYLDALLELARIHCRLGEYSQVVNYFEETLRYIDKNYFEERLKYIDEKFPASESGIELFAYSLERTDNYDRAIEVCQKIINIYPNRAFAFYLIGHIKHKQGYLAEAEQYLDNALTRYRTQYDSRVIYKRVQDAQSEYEEVRRKRENQSNS